MHTKPIKTPQTNSLTSKPIVETTEEKSALRAKSVKEYTIKKVERNQIKNFMEKWHYSHNINGLIADYCFALYYHDTMIGAIIYGRMAMANQWKKYGKEPNDVIELRRLACIDDTLRNTESYFIGRTLRWLKKNTSIKVVVSYADTFHGHQGIIYKASNFKYEGKTATGRIIMYHGKQYHDKTIRTKYKGKLKPFAIKIKKALSSGEAVYVKTPGKNIYLYKINK